MGEVNGGSVHATGFDCLFFESTDVIWPPCLFDMLSCCLLRLLIGLCLTIVI